VSADAGHRIGTRLRIGDPIDASVIGSGPAGGSPVAANEADRGALDRSLRVRDVAPDPVRQCITKPVSGGCQVCLYRRIRPRIRTTERGVSK